MARTILSLSDFKAGAKDLLDELRDGAPPIVLTQNGRARAIVEDYEAHEARERSLVMLKLMLQGEADVQHGRLTEQSEVFATLRHRLTARVADE